MTENFRFLHKSCCETAPPIDKGREKLQMEPVSQFLFEQFSSFTIMEKKKVF